MSGRSRTWLAASTALIATSAYAGALALITRVLDLGDTVNARLPFHSAVFAGVALALVVGVPMSVVTYLAYRCAPRTSVAAVIAGVLLLGWVAVEIGIIGTYTWLQPVLAFAGLAIMMAGLRDFPARVRR